MTEEDEKVVRFYLQRMGIAGDRTPMTFDDWYAQRLQPHGNEWLRDVVGTARAYVTGYNHGWTDGTQS